MKKNDSSDFIAENLIDISGRIKKVYDELFELKASNKEESEEYNLKLIELHNLLYEEKNIYDCFDTKKSEEKIKKTKDAVYSKLQKVREENLFYDIFSDEDICIRIMTKLNLLIDSIYNKNAHNYTPDMINISAPFMGINLLQLGMENFMLNLFYLKDSVSNDILYSYLYFLEKAKFDGYNNDVIKLIIKEEFNTMFKFGINESSILKNKLKAPESIYLGSNAVFEMEKVSSETHQEFVDNLNSLLASKCLSDLTEITDFDYLSIENVIKMIKLTALIKSSFIGMSEKSVNKIETSYNDFLNEVSYKKNHLFNKRSEEEAKKTLRETQKNKTNAFVLSLVKNQK